MVGVSSEGLTASVQSPQSHFCDVAGLNAHARPGLIRRRGKGKGGESVCIRVSNYITTETL